MMMTRTLTDLEAIDLCEALRRSVLERSPRTARAVEDIRKADWKAIPSRERGTLAIAAMMDIDVAIPAARRHARQLLIDLENAGLLAEQDSSRVREEVFPVYTNLSPADQAAMAGDLRFVMRDEFTSRLSQVAGPVAALDLLDRSCAKLKGQRAAQFLAALAYPVIVADKSRRRWAHRYGLLAEVKETRSNRNEALKIFGELAHRAAIPAAELNVVLGVFTGAQKVESEDAALCLAEPRCSDCPLREGCQYGRFRLQQGSDANGAGRRNLATAMLPEDRPREKLARVGAGALSSAELLAILLRTGTEREHAVELASKILRTAGSLDRLAHMSIGELTRMEGLGPVKAVTIQAALELARRLGASQPQPEEPPVTGSRDVFERLKPYFLNRRKEQFVVLLLNAKRRITRQIVVTEGILNQSLVHPREAFQEAIKDSASAVIFVHNHPSGDSRPSRDDMAITHRLTQTGAIIGIPVLDHVIMGGDNYYSFADSGTLDAHP